MTKKPFKNSGLIQKDMYKGSKQVQLPLNASHLIHIYQKYIFFSRHAFGRIREKMFLKYLKYNPLCHQREEERIGLVDAYECVIKDAEV